MQSNRNELVKSLVSLSLSLSLYIYIVKEVQSLYCVFKS